MAALLIALSLAAALVDTLVRTTLASLDAEAEAATRNATAWLRSTAARQRQAIGETQQVLRSIAGLSSLPSLGPARCLAFITGQAERHPGYGNLGILRPDGQVQCSVRPLSDDQGKRLAQAVRRGGPILLPAPGTAGLLIAVPAPGKPGTPAAAVFAERTLPGLDGRPDDSGDLAVELFTRTGLILARRPDATRLAGRAPPDVPLIEHATARRAGSGQLAGPDGVSRYYAYVPLEDQGTELGFLAAGRPAAAVHADTRPRLYRQLAALVALAVALARLAGVGGDRFLQRLVAAFAAAPPWSGRTGRYRRGRLARLLVTARRSLRRRLAWLARQWSGKRSRAALEQTIESLRRAAGLNAKLDEMSQLLQICATLEESREVVARFARELFPGTQGALFMISASRSLLESVAAWGGSAGHGGVFHPEDCWAVRLGRTHGSHSQNAEPQCAHVAVFPPGGYLCVPMVVRGEILGTLHLQFASRLPQPGREDGERDRRKLAETFAERTALALSNLQLRESLRAQSIRDALTGLYNRRFLNEVMEIESHRAQRNGTSIGIIMLDIDHFKRFNDRHGHAAGDALLRRLGEFLREQVRDEDVPCRYGGEEFIVILPGASLQASRKRAEALRGGVASLKVDYQGSSLGPVTLSLGVACHSGDSQPWQQTVKAADAALYRAKTEGRDRVCVAEAAPDIPPH